MEWQHQVHPQILEKVKSKNCAHLRKNQELYPGFSFQGVARFQFKSLRTNVGFKAAGFGSAGKLSSCVGPKELLGQILCTPAFQGVDGARSHLALSRLTKEGHGVLGVSY